MVARDRRSSTGFLDESFAQDRGVWSVWRERPRARKRWDLVARSGLRDLQSMFGRFLASKTDAAYSLLRIVSGLMFAFHGVQKLFGVFGPEAHVLSQLWVGGVIELVAGTFIVLGFGTRCAAFVASGQMAVAYVQFHWKLALGSRFFPAVNRGELALLYSFLFLYVACRGAGAWSVGRRRE
jgi:putative oxidoreductase